jgi:hypothetical protein
VVLRPYRFFSALPRYIAATDVDIFDRGGCPLFKETKTLCEQMNDAIMICADLHYARRKLSGGGERTQEAQPPLAGFADCGRRDTGLFSAPDCRAQAGLFQLESGCLRHDAAQSDTHWRMVCADLRRYDWVFYANCLYSRFNRRLCGFTSRGFARPRNM